MPILSDVERQTLEREYAELLSLIRKRQSHEALAKENLSKTMIDFPNPQGWTLLQIAIKLGDINKINALLTESEGRSLIPKNNKTPTPMTLAFMYGDFELLINIINHPQVDKNISTLHLISTIDPEFIDKPNMRHTYSEWINGLRIKPVLEGLHQKINIPLKPTGDLSKRSYLDYAAETGNIEFLKIFFKKNENRKWENIDFLDLYNPLVSAISNKQYETLACLLEKIPADLKAGQGKFSNSEFFTSALHIASKLGDWQSAELLIRHGANINLQDCFGKTPLYHALENNHEEFVKNLMQKKPLLNTLTITGETVFHASHKCSAEIQKILENNIEDSSLVHRSNIYGKTPENFNSLMKGIGQNKLVERFIYYAQLNYLSTEYLNEEGYCNGLVFLWHYYQSRGKLDFFEAMLRTIVEWDGTEESLKKTLDVPLVEVFKTRKELFETLLNWLVWYQHTGLLEKETGIAQGDRLTQFEGKIDYIIKPIDLSKLDNKKKQEYHTILSRLPRNTHIEGGGEGHVVGYSVGENQQFLFYDPNLEEFILSPLMPGRLTQLEMDTKTKALGGSSVALVYKISAYFFEHENINLEKYSYFCDEELPRSQEEAMNYVKKSPNRLSHLHVASLTHSRKNVEELLKTNYCNINSKDAHGYTPFDIAVHTGDSEFCQLFLNSKTIDLNDAKSAMIAYKNHDVKILMLIIEHPCAINLISLFKESFKNNDTVIINNLLENHKIRDNDIAEIIFQHKNGNSSLLTELTESMKLLMSCYEKLERKVLIKNLILDNNSELALEIIKKEDLLNLSESLFDLNFFLAFLPSLMQSDISPEQKEIWYKKIFSDIQSEIMTPLEDQDGQTLLHAFCSINDIVAIKVMLQYCANNINQVCNDGNTALHVAIKSKADFELIKTLIECGAQSNIRNKSGETALDFAEKLELKQEIIDLLKPKNTLGIKL